LASFFYALYRVYYVVRFGKVTQSIQGYPSSLFRRYSFQQVRFFLLRFVCYLERTQIRAIWSEHLLRVASLWCGLKAKGILLDSCVFFCLSDLVCGKKRKTLDQGEARNATRNCSRSGRGTGGVVRTSEPSEPPFTTGHVRQAQARGEKKGTCVCSKFPFRSPL